MRCPACGGRQHKRPKGPHDWRHPKVVGDAVWRLHQCQTCSHIFLSVQKPMTQEEVEAAESSLP